MRAADAMSTIPLRGVKFKENAEQVTEYLALAEHLAPEDREFLAHYYARVIPVKELGFRHGLTKLQTLRRVHTLRARMNSPLYRILIFAGHVLPPEVHLAMRARFLQGRRRVEIRRMLGITSHELPMRLAVGKRTLTSLALQLASARKFDGNGRAASQDAGALVGHA